MTFKIKRETSHLSLRVPAVFLPRDFSRFLPIHFLIRLLNGGILTTIRALEQHRVPRLTPRTQSGLFKSMVSDEERKRRKRGSLSTGEPDEGRPQGREALKTAR